MLGGAVGYGGDYHEPPVLVHRHMRADALKSALDVGVFDAESGGPDIVGVGVVKGGYQAADGGLSELFGVEICAIHMLAGKQIPDFPDYGKLFGDALGDF